eukprot:4399649-Lingulodinium_polyedra.AAC.1
MAPESDDDIDAEQRSTTDAAAGCPAQMPGAPRGATQHTPRRPPKSPRSPDTDDMGEFGWPLLD